MVLKCKNLTKRYLFKKAVDGFDAVFESGKIYALLGPNGSGKSTLMKMIAGLTMPDGGEIIVDNRQLSWRDKADIAYMPTEGYFYSYMNGIDAGKFYKDFFTDFDEELYFNLLSEMELDPKQKIKTMSSGMAAKLKIAVTMARHARIIMLDEPFNGIDLLARDKVMQTVVRNISDDVTMIISSHMVEELEKIVDAAIFMKDGKFICLTYAEEARDEMHESLEDTYRRIYSAGN